MQTPTGGAGLILPPGVRAFQAGLGASGEIHSAFCVVLDALNDYITTPHKAAYSLAIPFSLSFWIKYTQTGNTVVWEKNDNSGFSVQTPNVIYTTGALTLWVGGAANGLRTSGAFNDGNWHHIVFVVTAVGAGLVYVDGVLNNSTVAGSGPQTPSYGSSTPVYVGSRGGSFGCGMTADDMRMYSAAISATDAANLYAGQNVTTGLVAYWPLDEGTGTTTAETVAGGTGTLTNGPTWSSSVPAPIA